MNDDLQRLLHQLNINRGLVNPNIVPLMNVNIGANHNQNRGARVRNRPQNDGQGRGQQANVGPNRGGNAQRGADGHRGFRGADHGRGTDRNRGTERGRTPHRGNRGRNRGRARNNSVSRVPNPQMDWFNMGEASGMSRAHSVTNIRQPTGENNGRYTPDQTERRDHRRDGGRQGDNRSRHHNIGFRRLQDINKMEPDEIICSLLKEEEGFDKLLKTDLSPDFLVLILRVIRKICDSVFTQNTTVLLSFLCEPDFVNKLQRYIQDINLQDPRDKRGNTFFWSDTNQFWDCLITIFESILKSKPNTACEVLPKMLLATTMTINSFTRENPVPQNIREKLDDLQIKLILCQEERERKKKIEKNERVEDPPDDFRKIKLYPSVDEITIKDDVFIRPIIVEGKYQSVEHYLDVQFRLLREDFVAPLREGITDYMRQLETRDKKRIYDVRIYPNVRFIKSENIHDKVIRLVQFNQNPKKNKIRFENSKRFMFGSLVCFTKDRFQSVVFGTICERNIECLRKCQIGVDMKSNAFEYKVDYIMVECSVYFERYYHVLKALQMMDVETFPLKKYIIEVSNDIQPPAYLNDMSVLQQTSRHIAIHALDLYMWPSAEKLGLDKSQYRAFQSALTKEFCVIQGPPGTGKTYIGLRIAEILLENKRLWRSGPILVICFTNHALDQFLEGIIEYTDEVVRVGGQSKNEKLKPFNIKELRYKTKFRDTSHAMFKVREKLRESIQKIKTLQGMIDIVNSYNKLIDIKVLDGIDPRINHSWFSRKSKQEILEWLIGGHNVDQRTEERRRMRVADGQGRNIAAEVVNEAVESDSDSEGSVDDFFDAVDEIERIIDDSETFDVKVEMVSVNKLILAHMTQFEEKCAKLHYELQNIADLTEDEYVLFNLRIAKMEETQQAVNEMLYVQYRLDQHRNRTHPPPPLLVNYENPNLLTPNERWGLYWKWVEDYAQSLYTKMYQLENLYRRIYRSYEEVKSIEDIRLMRTMSVIGMTTTGAARYQTMLQALKCPIVIVEEAAEVLESHVVVSLTSDCQHLILIGDHKQLRPTTAVYHLAKKYNLEISLFERMVRNNVHCQTLEVQHRMRPEIAKLIVPSIYAKLDNHISVHSYSPVHGVTSNLFFLTHTEEETVVSEGSSRKNIYEAKFLIKLARHFILQGYDSSEITILATYSGQMFCLWQERKEYPLLKDVRITVVDNFQGEENKIILLSLVRSNAEGNIGFLKTDNRVCVALSRAKEGLFILGNMDILVKNNNIWPQIKDVLEEQKCIGTHITLKCQIHQDQLAEVRMPEDFIKVSEGGCTLMCNKQLDCGHVCASVCHITDREHNEYKCKEPCIKVLCEVGHRCPDLCFTACRPCMVPMQVILTCGHIHYLPCHRDPTEFQCTTLVDVMLECGHEAKKPCYRETKSFPCPHPCEIRRLCGHNCDKECHVNSDPDHLQIKCFKPCGKSRANCSTQTHNCPLQCFEQCPPCEVKIKKHRTVCIHVHDIHCSEDVDLLICKKRCDKKLPCGHNCRMACSEPCGNCQQMVDKVHNCGKKLRMKCFEEPDRKKCTGKCILPLPCGHPCQAKCNQECTKVCMHLVDSPVISACGHKYKIPCYVKAKVQSPTSYNLLKYCSEPCRDTLSCLHACAGTCGKCIQGRIHSSCQAKCGATLICGHACEIPCRNTCQPCGRRCSYKCVHSICGKKCGEPCTSCKEPCERRCVHIRCSKRCGEMCDVPACTEPCPILLRCGHPCIGFCGDVCPKVCRICDPENEIFEILFGNEDEPDARFVYLEECKHIIESDAMENWLQQGGAEINAKHCPRCKTTITQTQRYSNYIKASYKDIIDVKQKLFGKEDENEARRLHLIKQIGILASFDDEFLTKSKHLMKILTSMHTFLQTSNRGKRQTVSKIQMNTYEMQIEIIETIIKVYKKCNLRNKESAKKCLNHANYLLEVLSRKNNRITEQDVLDFQLEIMRYEKFIQMCNIETDDKFKPVFSKANIKELHSLIWQQINTIYKYSNQQDDILKENIKKLCKLADENIKVTEEEKKMIIKAMGAQSGHWFKCPKGHTYYIGECGGANQISKCNECGAQIGGQNHALLSGNVHDGEMDNSRFAAWSNAANMQNYILD